MERSQHVDNSGSIDWITIQSIVQLPAVIMLLTTVSMKALLL